LIFAGGAAAFAVLNKITALFEVPWLLAAYVSEQRERKERLLSGSVTRRLAVCFAVVLGVLVSVIVQSSFERMVAFGRTSSAVEFAKILHGGMDGLSLVIKIMRGYLEEGFAVFVLLILLFLPLLRPQSALMCLGYIATFGVYCFGFGHFFSGRYLLTSLIPLSLLSAQAVDARWRYCGSGTSQISRWGSLKILPYLFSGGLFFCGLHWGKQLSTVLKDPLNNAYSSPAKASEWAPLRNDYEQYTVSAWASIGLDALRDVILDQLHSTKARQITLIGSPNFSPEVYVTRLLLLDNLRVGVVAADFNRWDFPFFVANCQRIAGPFRGGEDAEVVVVQLAPAEQSATGNPNVTDGFEAEAIREIPRSFLESRFRLYRAAPVKDEQLKKLAPRNGGRYPDGLVAPVFAEQVSIYGERGAQAIVISGVELLELERDKISVTVNGVEVPFVFEREEGRFRIVLHDALTPGEHNVRVFFGKWQMMLDPFEGGAAYPNIQRAVSARDVEVLQTRPALPIDPPPRTM
jgi:uncharacterized membrane protein